ncbi:transmembrane amino acid transporter protein [Ditylenchus destructor]|nr:transmembrane amino acid transporter protein [Ditylenchus destructor]
MYSDSGTKVCLMKNDNTTNLYLTSNGKEQSNHVKTRSISSRESGLSAKATLLNFVKGMVGPGTLFVPLAFKQGGLVTLPLLLFFGFLNTHCMLKIVNCSQYFSKMNGDKSLDYGNVAYEACAQSFPFARKYKFVAKLLVNTAIFLLQLGICSISFVFMAENLEAVTAEQTNYTISEKKWILILLIPVMFANFARSLKIIVFLSVIGYFFLIASLLFIFQYLLRAHHITDDLPWFTNFDGFMTASGSVLYAFEGQAMVLPMENGLQEPKKMVGIFGVLSVGMSIVTTVYAGTGLLGYVTYGQKINGSITLSLPQQLTFTVVKLMLTLVVFFGFVLQQYVMVDMLWPEIRKKLVDRQIPASTLLYLELAFRALLVTVAMIIAISVPNLGQIISFAGITSGNFLAFIFPAVIHTLTFAPTLIKERECQEKKIGWKTYFLFLQNGFFIFIGLFGLTAGLRAQIHGL